MKRRDEVLVGLMLIVTVAVGVAGTVWLARGGLTSGYPMYALFPWGAGLKNGQPVLLAGVNIGFVRKVELIPDGTLKVTLAVNNEYQIPEGTTAAVEPNGIFGDQLIALTPQLSVKTFMAEGDTIATGKGTPGTGEVLTKADSIAADVSAIASSVRAEFVNDGGIAELRKTTQELTALVSQLGAIAAEQSRELTLTQRQLRSTLAAVDSAVVDSTLKSFRASSANIAQLTSDLEQTRAQVSSILFKVDSGSGTAARLLNDPTLYARVDSLLLKLDALAADVKANPRRYINLRVF
jgi:phospholipid/cholesterol/gamma-HCH transport system substrate-binding protein